MQGVFNLDRSAKAIIAGAIAFASALASGYDDSFLSSSEKVAAVSAGIIALAGVWAFSNKYVKAGIGAAVAGLAALGVALQDDKISAQEWITIVLAVLVALYAIYDGVQNTEAVLVEPTPTVRKSTTVKP